MAAGIPVRQGVTKTTRQAMDTTRDGALAAAAAVRAGEITAVELVQAALDRIAEFEPQVAAWTHLDPELALERAREADERRRRGEPTGPLHGVPVGIKDIIDTADLPTECGTVLHAGRRPARDAAIIATLREAGAIILGKTVTTELAVYAPGNTRNPHNYERTPGGSSSGSAAAVAAYMVPLAVGSQTNGSVIRPASYCGVYGFKPSFGRISRHGVLEISRPLDTLGVFARDLEDLALLSDTLMVYDQRDPDMRPLARPGISAIMGAAPPVEPRLAFIRAPAWERAEQTTKDAFRELCEHLGDRVDMVDLPRMFDEALDTHRIIMEADLAKNTAKLYQDGATQLSERLREMIESGQRVLATEYNTARERSGEYAAIIDELMNDYDAILTPAATGEAPGYETTGDPAFCTIWSLCGVPSLNLPILQGPAGMPLGAQLVAAKGDDARLFRTARWLVESLQ